MSWACELGNEESVSKVFRLLLTPGSIQKGRGQMNSHFRIPLTISLVQMAKTALKAFMCVSIHVRKGKMKMTN